MDFDGLITMLVGTIFFTGPLAVWIKAYREMRKRRTIPKDQD